MVHSEREYPCLLRCRGQCGNAVSRLHRFIIAYTHTHTHTHTHTQDSETHEVTDMVSFYHLPSTVVHHPVHRSLNVAYSFYYFHTKTPLKDLLLDALIIAKQVMPVLTSTVLHD